MTLSKIAALLALTVAANCQATTIDFDDLTTRNNFGALGISGTYLGFQWSSSGGFNEGWASGTTSNQASGPTVPVSGSTYAWNWNGVRSLFIDFGGVQSVQGAHFAHLSPTFSYSSNTIQMFGYDAAQNQIAASGVLNLTNDFQFLNANFSNVHKLEIRSDRGWFSVDDIVLGQSNAVPEPASMALLGLGLFGLAASRRRKA